MDSLHLRAKKLLEKLISIKSFSFNEDKTANHIEKWLNENKIKTSRKKTMYLLLINIIIPKNLTFY